MELKALNNILAHIDLPALDFAAVYLGQRCQEALWELCKDIGATDFWDQEHLKNPAVQKLMHAVMKWGVVETCKPEFFNPEARNVPMPDTSGKMPCSFFIFPIEQGRTLVILILMQMWKACSDHYGQKFGAVKVDHLQSIFHDALARIDFKSFWMREDIAMLSLMDIIARY